MSHDEPLRVYFACVGNSGRSIMAQGFAERMGGDRVEARSGGTDPKKRVLPEVVEAMSEVGVDVSVYEPTEVDEAFAREADVVVTMGCGADACPAFADRHVETWPMDDPEKLMPPGVRRVRDGIAERVRELLDREL